MTLDEIRDLAVADYVRNIGRYQNHHPKNTDQFNAYERGWMQSLKRDGSKFVEGITETYQVSGGESVRIEEGAG